VTHKQRRPAAPDAVYELERLARLHTTREQGVQLQQLTLGPVQPRERQLGRFAGSRLRAGEDRPELHPHSRKSHPRDISLTMPAIGELPFRVETRAVGLRVGVTQQPELAGHSHEVLRA